MTGKDLILYILKNDLENEPLLQDGRFMNCPTNVEYAKACNVGLATVNAMIGLGMINSIVIDGKVYILENC